MDIVPSILTNSSEKLARKISLCEGVVDRVQIDIVDGVFADNKTIDPTALKYIETILKLDFHLMVANPISWVEKCASVGANSIVGQIETMGSQSDFVKKVILTGASPGLSVDQKTPFEKLDDTIVGDLDILLLMSISAGFGGQKFDPGVYQKIKRANLIKRQNAAAFNVCVDGGINQDNIPALFKMKVDEVIIGERLFEGDLKTNIDALQKIARSV